MSGERTKGHTSAMSTGTGFIIALSLGLLLGSFLYSGALLSGGGAVVGAEDTETWPFLWGFFWMADSLQQGEFPLRTDLMDHPVGGSLWLKEPAFSILTYPIQQTLGIPWAYTFTQLAHSLLGVVGVYLLGRLLKLRALPSILAGLIYGFCPHQLGEAYNGNLDAMNIGWLPLWLAAMVNIIKRRGVGPVLLGALALFLLFLGNQYYAIAAAVLSAPIALLALWHHGNESSPSPDSSAPSHPRWHPKGDLLGPALRVLIAVAIGAALFIPFGISLKASLNAPDQLTFIDAAPPLHPPYVSDAYHLLFPLSPSESDGNLLPFQDIVYQGVFMILLGLLGVGIGRRGAPWRFLFLPLGLGFVILSLGAVLYYKGEGVSFGEGPLFLPWAYLIVNVPVIGKMSLSHRLAIPAALSLAMAMAVALDGIQSRWGLRGVLASAALGLLALGEIFIYPPYDIPLATVSTPAGAHTKLLSQGKDTLPGAVLNVPMAVESNSMQIYFWYQALHGRPIDGSFRVGSWPSVTPLAPLIPQIIAPLMNARTSLPAMRAPKADDPLGIAALRDNGYRFLVFHPNMVLFSEEAMDLLPWGEALKTALGPGLHLSDDTIIYCLDPKDRPELMTLAHASLDKEEIRGFNTDWPEEISLKILGAPRDDHVQQEEGERGRHGSAPN